mgnify:CR=1 FL=1
MAEFTKSSDPLKEPDLIRFQSSSWQVNGKTFSWSPPTDVFKTISNLIIKIEIAGMKQSDIDVNFEDNYLIVSGNRTESREKRAYHQMEIRYGEFTTMIALPKGLLLDSAEAEYEDGFLVISIPFSQATTIQIKG